MAGCDELGFHLHSHYATREQAESALPRIADLEWRRFEELGKLHAAVHSPQLQIAHWRHDALPDMGEPILLHGELASPLPRLGAADQGGFILLQRDGEGHYVGVASVRLDSLDQISALAAQGENWVDQPGVVQLLDNPRPIVDGDLVQGSDGALYRIDGRAFSESPLEVFSYDALAPPAPRLDPPAELNLPEPKLSRPRPLS